MPSSVRFLRQYLRPAPDAAYAVETVYTRAGGQLPATLVRPAGVLRRLPGWVMLHGLTRTGRNHPTLVHLVECMAAAGNMVLVPEIPEWRELRVAPEIAVETIRAAVHALRIRADVIEDRIGLLGFSFGATQSIIAAADRDTASELAAVGAWGGYCDLRRLCRFGLTGQHELDGTTYETEPDPYGAWIMAANYLPRTSGYGGSEPVAEALRELAFESGDRGVYAWDPVYDASKRRLRAGLAPRHRGLFDLIAPETTARRQHGERRRDLGEAVAAAALELDPLLDPRPILPSVDLPVLVAHGRDDRLIPFTESIRLAHGLPARSLHSLNVTALFQHSGATYSGLGPLGLTREAGRFLLLLRRLLSLNQR